MKGPSVGYLNRNGEEEQEINFLLFRGPLSLIQVVLSSESEEGGEYYVRSRCVVHYHRSSRILAWADLLISAVDDKGPKINCKVCGEQTATISTRQLVMGDSLNRTE